MTVSTGGPIRGLLGRWMMRFEASQQVLRLVFQATTAVSTLSGVLAYVGYQWAVPYILGIGGVGIVLFAFAYTEFGIYNRKNRERQEYGANFARPGNRIDDEMIGAGVFAAVHGRPPDEDEAEAIADAVDDRYQDLRDGVEI